MQLILREDHTVCVQVVTTGNNPTMRHVERAHNVSVKWLHEQHQRGVYKMERADASVQAADIFTKPCTGKQKWLADVELINMIPPGKVWHSSVSGGGTPLARAQVENQT